MWKDEVLEEIYRIREEHAKSFNYDLKAICDDLRKRQAMSDRKLISTPQFKQQQTKSFPQVDRSHYQEICLNKLNDFTTTRATPMK